MIRVLTVGRSPEILARVKSLLESAGYVHFGALTDERAVASMAEEAPDVLVIGGGVEPASREALREAFRAARPGRPVIEHSGGPHGLLDAVKRAS
jgi:DNA-binding response OmpR family regulator